MVTISDSVLAASNNYHSLSLNKDGELIWESLLNTDTTDAVMPEDNYEGPDEPLFILFTPRTLAFNLQTDGSLRMVLS